MSEASGVEFGFCACGLKFRAAEFEARRDFHRGNFSTAIRNFAQIFWTISVDGEKGKGYFARQIEPKL